MANLPGTGVSEMDKQIFEIHNNIRKNPKSLVKDLEEMLTKFDGLLLKRDAKVTLRTKEGEAAVKEAIEYLNKQSPIGPLKWSEEIQKAAGDHTKDIGPRGLIQHDSSDGKSGVKDRLRKYGNVVSCYGENLSFHCDEAKAVLIQLIVDDGVINRGHRENIFNPEFNVVGINTGEHKDFGTMTCLDYAGGFVAFGEPDPIEKQMDAFLKEDVEFEMPDDVRSWKQNSKIQVQGNVAKKTTVRVLKMKDGTDRNLEKTEEKKFTI